MSILVLTDIFGKNYLSEQISTFSNVVVLDPYQNESLFFTNEEEAYKTFLLKCGHERYFQRAFKICQEKSISSIIGFSIGGTVAWRLSSLAVSNLNQIFCFYPSQIRNYMEINPMVNTNIIFAKKENSFNTQELSLILSKKKRLFIEISEYNHGFMNEKSENYSNKAFDKYFQYLKKFN